MNLLAWLERAARHSPRAAAVFHGRSPWASYSELAARAARLAEGLRSRSGLAAGDRVAIAMKNAPEYLEALYGIWWAGLVAVPVNAKLHPREVQFIVDDAEARVVIEDPRQVRDLAAPEGRPLAATGQDDLAWLFYTSGTTGRPKGAMLSHRNLAHMTYSYFLDVDPVPAAGRLLHA